MFRGERRQQAAPCECADPFTLASANELGRAMAGGSWCERVVRVVRVVLVALEALLIAGRRALQMCVLRSGVAHLQCS